MIRKNSLNTRLGEDFGKSEAIVVRKSPTQIVKCSHKNSFAMWLMYG